MPIIEELLSRSFGRSRWVPHNCNPSDGLTKFKGAHFAPMLELLDTGCYTLQTEEINLQERAAAKAATGNTPRVKQSGIRSNLMVGAISQLTDRIGQLIDGLVVPCCLESQARCVRAPSSYPGDCRDDKEKPKTIMRNCHV